MDSPIITYPPGGGSGSSALSAITAATAANTIASGNNTGQIWNWANTADATVAFTFGETSAATGGTSTSGVPNQVLFKLATVAASTQSPLSVYSRGNHVFSVSPTATQLLGANGAAANPMYAFAANVNTGIYNNGGALAFSVTGTFTAQMNASQLVLVAGSASAPSLSSTSQSNDGIWFPGSSVVGFAASGTEQMRLSAGILQISQASATAVSFALNTRKSRGTVAAPTVITTGDALLTESAYGYVGATNTYKEATRIEHDSTGTIADSTSGIGGIVKILTTLAGTDTAVQEVARFFGGSNPMMGLSGVLFANLGTPSNGTMAYCSDCDAPTLVDSTCTSSGAKTGSLAFRVNGAWKCVS